MPTRNRVLDLSADEIALMGQLGINETRIREILAAEAPSPHPNGLSAPEREILRRGGARGLDDSPAAHRRRQRQNIEALIQECRALLQNAHNTAAVASLLRRSQASVVNLAHQAPPQLSAFEGGSGSLNFPDWQFDETGTIPHLSDLLAVAGATLPLLILTRFMVTPHVDLEVDSGPLSPRAWLVRGLNPEPVLDAVRAMM